MICIRNFMFLRPKYSMIELIYSSVPSKNLSPQDIDSLLLESRENNTKNSITGVLLFNQTRFLQIIEGTSEDIHSLFNKIEVDPRHKNVELLHEQPIQKRTFQNWKMGYFIPRTGSLIAPFKDIEALYAWDQNQVSDVLGDSYGYKLFLKYMQPPIQD